MFGHSHSHFKSTILGIIQSKCIPSLFNASSSVVTTRRPNSLDAKAVDKWSKFIPSAIRLRVLTVAQTEDEVAIMSNIYLRRWKICIQTIHHGTFRTSDDFGDWPKTFYDLHLVKVVPISRSDFGKEVVHKSFMPISEQMDYVQRINYMHQNEDLW